MKRNSSIKPVSFRNTALRTTLIIVIPLFLAISLFVITILQNQREAVNNSKLTTLTAYQTQIENTTQLVEQYLQEVSVNNEDFASIVYAHTKTDAYAASQTLTKELLPLLRANQLIGGFYLYSQPFDYFRPINLVSYSVKDAVVIKEAIVSATHQGTNQQNWQTVHLSDRTVMLAVSVFRETAVAAVLDMVNLEVAGIGQGEQIFAISAQGDLYDSSLLFQDVSISQNGHIQNLAGDVYDTVQLSLPSLESYILYISPAVSLWQQLNFVQKILLFVILLLLVSVPSYWVTFRRQLLEPLESLTVTMKAIQGGDVNLRVPQNSKLKEVNAIAWTVNTMLDSLQEQKIASYEQKLELQRSQLQYLQLQIRPHFYLNCLNIIFSLAEKRKYKSIQQVVLDLSVYLRGMFRDSSTLIPLSTELHSVESFIRIQQESAQQKPIFQLEVAGDVTQASVPPLCILTFVENSIKHSSLTDSSIRLRVKCGMLSSEEGDWLNITITDNCGGISQEDLQQLNHPSEELYRENHVGIFNVIQRLRLLYGESAQVSFRNEGKGACVELFLPLKGDERKEGETD